MHLLQVSQTKNVSGGAHHNETLSIDRSFGSDLFGYYANYTGDFDICDEQIIYCRNYLTIRNFSSYILSLTMEKTHTITNNYGAPAKCGGEYVDQNNQTCAFFLTVYLT